MSNAAIKQNPNLASPSRPPSVETQDALDDVQADFSPIEELKADADEFARGEDPYHEDSRGAEQAFEAAVEAAKLGDEERAVAHYLKAAKLAENAHEWYLSAVACHRVGDFLTDPKPPADLARAFRMYRRAIASYERCGMLREARDLSYLLMAIRMQRPRELNLNNFHRIQLFLFWATAGFGFRPLRVIATALVVVFLYAAIFWGIGGVIASKSGETADFWHSLYFSGITFATVGYGDFIPAPHGQMLALTEGAIGAFTIAFFVAVFANWLNKV
ncbi:MAG: two pore domain potassium channel family protein [Chlorobia bacterium]|nr:two pore domain potassium channel family protein [Fimbriimonadaceae bacterium]